MLELNDSTLARSVWGPGFSPQCRENTAVSGKAAICTSVIKCATAAAYEKAKQTFKHFYSEVLAWVDTLHILSAVGLTQQSEDKI